MKFKRKYFRPGPWTGGFFCIFMMAFSLIGQSSAIERTFPSADCPDSAQDCLNQLCDASVSADEIKILHVLPGTHRWGPSTLFGVPTVNNLFAFSCSSTTVPQNCSFCSNLQILGAGTGPDGSTIDCTDSANFRSAPCMVVGTPAIYNLSQGVPDIQNIKIKGIRFVCSTNCSPLSVGAVGIEGLTFQENRTEGFSAAIQVNASNHVTIRENEFMGLGTGTSSFAIQKAFGSPNGDPDPNINTNNPDANLNHDWVISKNTITDTTIGMDLIAITASTISKNKQTGGRVGIRIRGGENNVYLKNTIVGISPAFLGTTLRAAGMSLRTENSSVLSKNQICITVSAPSLRFDASNPNFELAIWPSFTNGNSDLLIVNNEFFGYDPNVCGVASETGIAMDGYCFDDSAFPGGVSDGGGNQFINNEMDPSGSCPTDL